MADIDRMTPSEFLDAFGDVAEHSPWVARACCASRPFVDREAMICGFERAMQGASREAQLALVRAHPDLATKAKLTDDSSKEQAGANLDTLSAEEFERFTALNARYRERFGFPFIFAVKGATKHMILESFESRLENSPDDEFAMAIAQVCRIFRFRIEDRVSP